jgi:3'(2'), 5'-bisphosphate nucleotidase
VVSLPSDGTIYLGSVKSQKAYQVDANNNIEMIKCKSIDKSRPIVVHSRHESAHTLTKMFGLGAALLPMGSARKFVMMATGQADYYVRTFGLSEYDIAGGHALAEAAGCTVTQANGQPLVYGDPSLHIGSFVISAEAATL